MKKDGFTLIEIIVSLCLITVVFVSSFFCIKVINNNIRISKLEEISDKAIEAAEIYIETNDETYNELYKKQNGVVIPLNVLVDEGLLDLSTTTLEDKDIENEYVVTALGGSTPQDSCIDIRTTTSWNEKMSEPIYICTDSNGNSNIKLINPSDLSNKNKVEREIFYYKGEYPNNYLVYKKNGVSHNMRILSVDTDDSITVVKGSWHQMDPDSRGFDKIFNQNECFTTLSNTGVGFDGMKNKCINDYFSTDTGSNLKSYYGKPLTQNLYDNTVECELIHKGNSFNLDNKSWIKTEYSLTYLHMVRYLHLKPCMKISSGTGAEDNPFVLESKCS